MKKANLKTWCTLVLAAVLGACSESPEPQQQTTAMLAPPPPQANLLANDVHAISYHVLTNLATGYTACDCEPDIEANFFGAFFDTTSLHNLLGGSSNGLCLHFCLSSGGTFYMAASAAVTDADSVLAPTGDFPITCSPYIYGGSSVDAFIESTTFGPSGCSTARGSEINTDRRRFGAALTCDLDGNATQDTLQTVPVAFLNKNQLQMLISQSTATYVSVMLGYDPTSSPNVMRAMWMSTYSDAGQVKLMKTNGAEYALMLERGRP
ncbi:MAG: hypothetical protein ACKVOR_05200 [Flavobacteriales bacterium]